MDEIRIVAELEVLPEHREAMLPAFRAMVEASDAAIAEHNASAHFKAFGDFQKDKLARKRVTLLRPVC